MAGLNTNHKHEKSRLKIKGIICLTVFIIVTFTLQTLLLPNTIYLEGSLSKDTSTHAVHVTLELEDGETVNGNTTDEDTLIKKTQYSPKNGTVHNLKCDAFGGPDDLTAAEEMVYWLDIPSDSTFVSPFKHNDEEQYVTYEPDYGAFKNMRMTWENVVVFAIVTGRTLVLLPERRFPYIEDSSNGQKDEFTFNDFYHLQEIKDEHPGLNIITTKEFLEKAVKGGILPNPPDDRYDWDNEDLDDLLEYLHNNTYEEAWEPDECVCVIPSGTNSTSVVNILTEVNSRNSEEEENDDEGEYTKYIDNPSPVDGSVEDRFREIQNGRTKLCLYNEKMQKAPVVNFRDDDELGGRLLAPFQSFYFFEDWKEDLFVKRFVRDHMRYKNEIMCAAARIVEEIRNKAQTNMRKKLNITDGKVSKDFHSAHVRRGDFADAFESTQISPEQLLERSKVWLEEGSTLYILTDQKDEEYFAPMKETYNIFFLSDFQHLLDGVNTNFYGMIEQLIAARGKIFIGTYLSTFTAHINRLRGYYSTKHRLPGYENGSIESYYFTDPTDMMKKYNPIHGPYWAHEFSSGWRDIDKDVDFIN